MVRFLRLLTLGVLLAYSAPVMAQSFEGLDLGESSPKKKKKRGKRGTKEKTPDPAESRDPAEQAPAADPAPAADTSAPAAEQPAAAPPADTGGLGLDLSAPVTPKETKKGKGKGGRDTGGGKEGGGKEGGAAMQFEGLDVSNQAEDRARLDIAINQFKANQYEQAALTTFELINDPKFVELAPEAHYVLAKSLYRMGLYHSSLAEFSKVLARGPEGKFFKTSLEWLFYISRKTVNESVVLDEIAKYSNQEFPEKFRNEFHYLLARYHYVRGRALDRADRKAEATKSFEDVRRTTALIPRGDPFFARAKYLEGLSYYRDGANQQAVDVMREVARATRAEPSKANEDLRELAMMQLARVHYGARQNRKAIHYYQRVARGNEQWLEALFEASWANYRIGQFEQALGNLITLSSPFFRDEYFPEALILKAVIYYENCRYRESSAILEDFERIYLPVHDELDALLKRPLDAAEYYNVLADVQKKNKEQRPDATQAILERILRLALTDQDLKKTNDSILELEGELDGYGNRGDTFKYSELSKTLIEELKAQRETLIGKAGLMARSKLERELGELKKLLANALRIKFETTTKEKEFLQGQLRAGGDKELVKKYRFSVAVADDELYWPFEGEYWRDELGTYQYTLTKGCVDRDTANRAGGEGM